MNRNIMLLVLLENKDFKKFLSKKYTMLSVVLFGLFCLGSEGAVCQRYDYVIMQNDAAIAAVSENPAVTPFVEHAVKVNYTCPGPKDPRHHSECCSSPDFRKCCPRERYFYEIDKTIATIIALSVISFCIFVTVLVAVCCFWSKCPLYSSCRAELAAEIASSVSKDDGSDLDTMPREISRKDNKFSPIAISNGNIPSGVDMEAI